MSFNDSNAKNFNKYFPWTISIKNTPTESSFPNGLKTSKSFVGLNHYSIINKEEKTSPRRYSNFFGILDGKKGGINCSKSGDFYDDVILLWNKLDLDCGMIKCKIFAQSVYNSWLPINELSWIMKHSNIIDNVRLLDSFDSSFGINGKLHITVTHLIFLSDDLKEEKWILIHLISSIESPPVSSLGKTLTICSKDFYQYRFVIDDSNVCEKLRLVLIKLIANIDQYDKLPCFSASFLKSFPQSDGWVLPNVRLKSSFQRMGLPNSQWKFININENYKMSDTYPSVIVVPHSVSKSVLEACSKFRSRGRLPVLTYYYSPSKSAMCRCSQPLVGFSARCNEDIMMLKRIKDAAANNDKLHVVDTRPKINALTNKARGKGYESDIDYEQIVFQFFQIENIHVMRSSLEKLIKGGRSTRQSYLSFVEKSGWFKHIKWILEASFYIAQKLRLGENVVVHCSDGWDRTSQVCALTQILLDPYYRTIEGLEDLIERDWLSFGHKFSDRCGHLSIIDQSEISPVFTQFLDCIYQLYNCYPDQFEYNERLLRHLHKWSQDCVFGTFVGNCEKDRLDLKIHERSYSVWGYIKSNLWNYLNSYYNRDQIIPVIDKMLKNYEFSFWFELYCPIEDCSNVNSCSINIPDNLFHMQRLNISVKLQNEYLLGKSGELIKMLLEQKENNNGILSSVINRFTEIKQKMGIEDSDQNNNMNNCLEIMDKDWNETLLEEMALVAVKLPSLHLEKTCVHCNHNLDKLSRMNLCYSCGQYVCHSCIRDSAKLPGHGDVTDTFPVCLICSDKIREYRSKISGSRGNNEDTLQQQQPVHDPLMDIVRQRNALM